MYIHGRYRMMLVRIMHPQNIFTVNLLYISIHVRLNLPFDWFIIFSLFMNTLKASVPSVYSTGEIPHMRCTFTSYEVLRSRNSNSTKKRGFFNPFRKEDSVFISHSTLQNHFCLGLSSFGELKF